jgi:hypothetical protein
MEEAERLLSFVLVRSIRDKKGQPRNLRQQPAIAFFLSPIAIAGRNHPYSKKPIVEWASGPCSS